MPSANVDSLLYSHLINLPALNRSGLDAPLIRSLASFALTSCDHHCLLLPSSLKDFRFKLGNIIAVFRITLIATREISLQLALGGDMKLLRIDVVPNSHQQMNQTFLLVIREGNLG